MGMKGDLEYEQTRRTGISDWSGASECSVYRLRRPALAGYNACGSWGRLTDVLARQAAAFAKARAYAEVPDWQSVVCTYDWPCDWAWATIECESSGMIDASSNPPYVGLFQIDSQLYGDMGDLRDPIVNIDAAYTLWARDGGVHWPNCP